jgi:hypothetical protein
MAKEKKQEQQPEDNGREIVPVGPRGGPLEFKPRPYWTSLDLSTNDGRALYMKAKNGGDLTPADVMGKDFLIQHVLIHEVDDVDQESGEVKTWVRYCLITPDGQIVTGGSSGIKNSIADLIELYGCPPWKNGLNVRMVSRKTSNKFTVHLLEPV